MSAVLLCHAADAGMLELLQSSFLALAWHRDVPHGSTTFVS